jgi:hypothetical protein
MLVLHLDFIIQSFAAFLIKVKLLNRQQLHHSFLDQLFDALFIER